MNIKYISHERGMRAARNSKHAWETVKPSEKPNVVSYQ